MEIGGTLKDLRKQSGKTLKEVAQEMGISKSALSNYENGKRLSDAVVEMLSAYYKEDVKKIVGSTETVPDVVEAVEKKLCPLKVKREYHPSGSMTSWLAPCVRGSCMAYKDGACMLFCDRK